MFRFFAAQNYGFCFGIIIAAEGNLYYYPRFKSCIEKIKKKILPIELISFTLFFKVL
jgi:hypothetical protein